MDTPAGRKGKPVVGGGGGSLSKADLASGRGNLGIQVNSFWAVSLKVPC